MLIRTANVLRRLDERWTDGDENRKLRALSAPASPPSRRFQTMWLFFTRGPSDLANFLRAVAEACSPQRFREENAVVRFISLS